MNQVNAVILRKEYRKANRLRTWKTDFNNLELVGIKSTWNIKRTLNQ